MPPETLQGVFDRAFAGIRRGCEAFAPQLVAPEVGTVTSVSTGIARCFRPARPGLPLERMTETEQAVREAATEVNEDLRARLASAEELSASDRVAVIEAARHALAPFLPTPEPWSRHERHRGGPAPEDRQLRRSPNMVGGCWRNSGEGQLSTLGCQRYLAQEYPLKRGQRMSRSGPFGL